MEKYLKIGTHQEICDAYNNGELGEPFVGYDPEDNSLFASFWNVQEWVYTLVYDKEENKNSFKFAGDDIVSLPLGYTVEHNDYVYAGTTLYFDEGDFYYLNSKGDYQSTTEYYFEQDASSFTFVVEDINMGKETIKALVFHPVLVENNKDDK